MQLECLIRRVGPTPIILGNTKYLFMPIPGTKYHDQKHRNFNREIGKYEEKILSVPEESTSVCEVQDEAHINHLLRSGQFRTYNQEKAIKEADERRKEKPIYQGYGIEKYLDLGYIAVDRRNKKNIFYAGVDLIWRKEKTGTYFKTEIEAYDFLREEVAASSSAEIQKELGEGKKADDSDLGKTLDTLSKGSKKGDQ